MRYCHYLIAAAIILFVGCHFADAHDDPHDGKQIGLAAPAGSGGGPFPSLNVLLLGNLPLSDIGGGAPDVLGNDCWGWTDPQTGKEYAIYGRTDGTSFIDASDPLNPVYLGDLPSQTGNVAWRDIKVYMNHAFVVSDNNGAHGMQVFDLTNLRGVTLPQTFSNTAHYGGFGRCHNIGINEDTGFAYCVGTDTFAGGPHAIDIGNPANPLFAGAFDGDGYTHDIQVVIYTGSDLPHVGREIAFCANTDTLTIVDFTDKGAPVQLSRTGYSLSGYSHQGWLTEDHRYFLMNDELDELEQTLNTRTHVWDILDLDSPLYVGPHTHSLPTIDHNCYVKGNLVFEANYTSGLRIFEMTDLAAATFTLIGYLDTFPPDDAVNFNGAWSVYPYFESGTIVVSDRQNGVFLARQQCDPPTINCPDFALGVYNQLCQDPLFQNLGDVVRGLAQLQQTLQDELATVTICNDGTTGSQSNQACFDHTMMMIQDFINAQP